MARPDDYLIRVVVGEDGRLHPCIKPGLYIQRQHVRGAVEELTRRVAASTKAAVAQGKALDGPLLIVQLGEWISWLMEQDHAVAADHPSDKTAVFPCDAGNPCGHAVRRNRHFVLEVRGLPEGTTERERRAVEDGLGAALETAIEPGQYINVSRRANEIHFDVASAASKDPGVLGVWRVTAESA